MIGMSGHRYAEVNYDYRLDPPEYDDTPEEEFERGHSCCKCGMTCYPDDGDKIRYGTIHDDYWYKFCCLDCYEEMSEEEQGHYEEYTEEAYDEINEQFKEAI